MSEHKVQQSVFFFFFFFVGSNQTLVPYKGKGKLTLKSYPDIWFESY